MSPLARSAIAGSNVNNTMITSPNKQLTMQPIITASDQLQLSKLSTADFVEWILETLISMDTEGLSEDYWSFCRTHLNEQQTRIDSSSDYIERRATILKLVRSGVVTPNKFVAEFNAANDPLHDIFYTACDDSALLDATIQCEHNNNANANIDQSQLSRRASAELIEFEIVAAQGNNNSNNNNSVTETVLCTVMQQIDVDVMRDSRPSSTSTPPLIMDSRSSPTDNDLQSTDTAMNSSEALDTTDSTIHLNLSPQPTDSAMDSTPSREELNTPLCTASESNVQLATAATPLEQTLSDDRLAQMLTDAMEDDAFTAPTTSIAQPLYEAVTPTESPDNSMDATERLIAMSEKAQRQSLLKREEAIFQLSETAALLDSMAVPPQIAADANAPN